MERNITEIIIQDTHTMSDMDIGVAEIRKWHMARGYLDVGYHYVIRRNGTIENGRPLEETGAYMKGHNANSIGICLVGGLSDDGKLTDNFSVAQKNSLRQIISNIRIDYPDVLVVNQTLPE